MAVRANQTYGIDGGFQPGVSQRTVPSEFVEIEGGDGYFTTPLRSFTDYNAPGFTTTSPYAQAWLEAKADVRAGVHTKVSALSGLNEWRKDIKGGGTVGGRLVEIDPSGLYVAGEEVVRLRSDAADWSDPRVRRRGGSDHPDPEPRRSTQHAARAVP